MATLHRRPSTPGASSWEMPGTQALQGSCCSQCYFRLVSSGLRVCWCHSGITQCPRLPLRFAGILTGPVRCRGPRRGGTVLACNGIRLSPLRRLCARLKVMRLRLQQVFPLQVNPCLAWAVQRQRALGLAVVGLRRAVVEDLRSLTQEVREDQDDLTVLLPSHVAQVYKQGSPTLQFQLVTLAWLLDLCQFPGRQDLLTELVWGFKMLGPLTPGSGWQVRTDAKYSRPLLRQEFSQANRVHVQEVLRQQGRSEHTDTMLQELSKERAMGRVVGPTSFPCARPVQVLQQVHVAKAFPVVQESEGTTKVRRADDWLRSFHNATVFVQDCLPYAGPPSVVALPLGCKVREKCRASLERLNVPYRQRVLRSRRTGANFTRSFSLAGWERRESFKNELSIWDSRQTLASVHSRTFKCTATLDLSL